MQELPTNRSSFPLKHKEDFNQTSHIAPHKPIVLNDNISFYCNSLSSVQDVFNESLMVMSLQFQYDPSSQYAFFLTRFFLTQRLYSKFQDFKMVVWNVSDTIL